MDIRAQVSMVFHLDKCIGCHTCSVACKNVWTDRKGAEYMWWNNVETKPGTGFPTKPGRTSSLWGGLRRTATRCSSASNGQLRACAFNIFHNPNQPGARRLLRAVDLPLRGPLRRPAGDDQPTARPSP
jgi:nitrate reductase beta subunit